MTEPYAVIPLTRGMSALVDITSLALVGDLIWTVRPGWSTWYAYRTEENKSIQMHRLILGLRHGDGLYVDHKNGNGLDNRKCNLRIALKSQNSMNSKRKRNSVTKYRGVTRIHRDWKGIECPLKRPWTARIVVNGRAVHLGYYRSAREAALIRDMAAIKFYGEFARLNVMGSKWL